MATTTTKSARSGSRVDALRARIPSSWRAEHMPNHLRHTEGKTKNARGQSLSYVSLFPPTDGEDAKPVRGVLFFLHGINEHCRRYYHLYEQLCESGFGVLAYDLLSHGQSDSCEHNMRAHAKQFSYFVDDTNDVLAFAKQSVFPQFLPSDKYPTLPPVILSGMSYGTLVSLHTVLSERHAFGAVVLVAPAVSVEMTTTLRVQRFFARPMSAIIPKARIVPAVNREWICRDKAFMEDFESDPLTIGGEMTTRMGEQSLSAMIELQKDTRVEQPNSTFCSAPILLMMGSNDKVTSLPVAKEFFNRIANRDKELKIFDGPYHALFDDPDKDQVFDHLIEWLHLRFPETATSSSSSSAAAASGVDVPEAEKKEAEEAPEPVAVSAAAEKAEAETAGVKTQITEEVAVETAAVETAAVVTVEVVATQVVSEQKTETKVKVVEATVVAVAETEQAKTDEAAELKPEAPAAVKEIPVPVAADEQQQPASQ